MKKISLKILRADYKMAVNNSQRIKKKNDIKMPTTV